ncbi:hypothetical protein BH11MYX4_BH11MYX4_27980 [soil metagenome]
MTSLTRTIATFVTVAAGIVLVSSPARADRRTECSEARSFLRSDEARRTCSSRFRSARSLSCTSPAGQRLLLSMARSCKARATAPSPPSSGGGSAGSKEPAEPKDAKHGTKASVTAYQMDGSTVLTVVPCEVGVVGPEYPKCVVAVKAKLKADLCKPPAKGPVKFKYRMGEIPQLLTDHVDC